MLLLRIHFWSAVCAIVKYHNTTVLLVAALQKQVCCFNHGVVTLVADKVERQWL